MAQAIMNGLCRGLVGYVSYLATCSASEVYSEYLLYEPILRIAQSKGFSVQCEKEAVAKARANPALKEALARAGSDLPALSPAEAEAFIRAESETWGGVIRAVAIRLD